MATIPPLNLWLVYESGWRIGYAALGGCILVLLGFAVWRWFRSGPALKSLDWSETASEAVRVLAQKRQTKRTNEAAGHFQSGEHVAVRSPSVATPKESLGSRQKRQRGLRWGYGGDIDFKVPRPCGVIKRAGPWGFCGTCALSRVVWKITIRTIETFQNSVVSQTSRIHLP